MHCAGCARNIENNLRQVKGVSTVTVDLLGQEVIIEHDGTTEEETIVQKLDQMGYPKVGDESLLKQAKSYVSCLIGQLK